MYQPYTAVTQQLWPNNSLRRMNATQPNSELSCPEGEARNLLCTFQNGRHAEDPLHGKKNRLAVCSVLKQSSPLCVHCIQICTETGPADDERSRCLCGTVCTDHVDTAHTPTEYEPHTAARKGFALDREADCFLVSVTEVYLGLFFFFISCVRRSPLLLLRTDGAVQHVSNNSCGFQLRCVE